MAPWQGPDLEVGASLAGQGPELVRQLRVRGFCALRLGCDERLPRDAVLEADRLNVRGHFNCCHPLLAENLLGEEGSSFIAEVPTSADNDLLSEIDGDGFEALRTFERHLVDAAFEEVKPLVAAELGFRLVSRGQLTLHKWGPAEFVDPPLEQAEGYRWLDTFVRHRVMAVVFLGPGDGRLDLLPRDLDEAETHCLRVTPGTLVVLRPDLLTHVWSAQDDAVAASLFALTSADNPRQTLGRQQWLPASRELAYFLLGQQEVVKEKEVQAMEAGLHSDDSMPDMLRKVRNQTCHSEKMVPMQSASCRLPCLSHPSDWMGTSFCGPDYATEVSRLRWDHSQYYSKDPRRDRTCCRHAAFLETTETFFPHGHFGIPKEDVRSTDPHQLLMLEVGYEAFHYLGESLQGLRGQSCAVYAASSNREFLILQSQSAFGQGKTLPSSLAQGVAAGRFSYSLGLRGTSLSIDAEAAGGLAALYSAAGFVEGGRGPGRGFQQQAVALAAHLCLSPLLWPPHSAANGLSCLGRCLSFDASADGQVRGEGCCAAILGRCVDQEDGKASLGLIAGGKMNSNGRSAGLATPNGPAEREVIHGSLRNAMVSPLDIDFAEAHGSGALLADAVEVGSQVRVHRPKRPNGAVYTLEDPALFLGSGKSSLGHQVDCGSLLSFLRTVFAARWGLIPASLHLRQSNPHVDSEDLAVFPSEAQEFLDVNPLMGALARGMGGSNVHVVALGVPGGARVPAPSLSRPESALAFWPGGGGTLGMERRPERAYTLVGTWSDWSEPLDMEFQGDGTYGAEVVLGENCWERFQIWLDGDRHRALHPRVPRAGADTHVMGPDLGDDCFAWELDGRPQGAKLGDRYLVQLKLAGAWRLVTWKRLPGEEQDESTSVPSKASYCLLGSWSNWQPALDLEPVEGEPGAFRGCVTLQRREAAFQIMRNGDDSQVLYPSKDSDEEVLGPDEGYFGRNWTIKGEVGQTFAVTLRRRWEAGKDVKAVTIETTTEAGAGTGPHFSLLVSSSEFRRPLDMCPTPAGGYEAVVQLKADEQGLPADEAFYIVRDGDPAQAIFPNVNRATTHKFHALKGPAENRHHLCWLIGKHDLDQKAVGARYRVELLLKDDGATPRKVQWSRLGDELPRLADGEPDEAPAEELSSAGEGAQAQP